MAGHSPFVAALEVMRIPAAALIVQEVVLVAVLSALNSGLYVSSRILFGLSQRGDVPANCRPHRRKVPRAAVLLSSVIGHIAIMAAIISPEGVFLFLVNASGAVMLFVYLAVALAQIKVCRQVEATAASRLTLKMWLFPWLSYAVVAVIADVLVAWRSMKQNEHAVLFSGLVEHLQKMVSRIAVVGTAGGTQLTWF
ncbi:hypothetical protein NF675_14750 [Pseudomonas siliginis]|uniref:hypothetical protein n=1 Tax=Pseudomonas siliginis TaxID=2842346 RepID=UPI0020935112|nr:hypothetical protein [Pseudomonas siliginis]UST72280.1 hypothetical protein NF675_14750 [Pseudomonas siliginis]